MIKVGIIGGGASGIMAAIQASEGARVTILERKDRIGKKILVTGNGRCNFSNYAMSSDYYYSDDLKFVNNTLDRFSNDDLVRFFTSLGVLTKQKNGYLYPASEQASTILDAFRYELKEREIDVITECNVIDIEKKDKFIVRTEDKRTFSFDKIIISTGGKAGLLKNETANGYSLLKTLGIKSTKTYPALTSLCCKGLNFKSVSGVRSECLMSLLVNGDEKMSHFGEVLFNDTGISGIVTFQMSHPALESIDRGDKTEILIDLLPELKSEDVENFVKSKYLLHSDITVEEFFTGFLNKKLNYEFIKMHGMKVTDSVSDVLVERLISCILSMKKLRLVVTGGLGYDRAQVTGGGIPLSEITPDFEVMSLPGLYITGELLNVDGICGGYNLQWAFSSGYIAGRATII